jgi:hypothetical protein
VDDHHSPSRAFDWKSVVLSYSLGQQRPIEVPMRWYGEYLWVATLPPDARYDRLEVCATDRAGNRGCATRLAGGADTDVFGGDPPIACAAGSNPCHQGGCCSASGDPAGTLLLVVVVGGLSARTRSRPRGCRSATPRRR